MLVGDYDMMGGTDDHSREILTLRLYIYIYIYIYIYYVIKETSAKQYIITYTKYHYFIYNATFFLY